MRWFMGSVPDKNQGSMIYKIYAYKILFVYYKEYKDLTFIEPVLYRMEFC